jgi:hypothetical protein
MGDETTFTTADVDRLATRLEPLCAGLDDADLRLLHNLFALAGSAVAADDDDVSGFIMPTDMPMLIPTDMPSNPLSSNATFGMRTSAPGISGGGFSHSFRFGMGSMGSL